MAYLLINRLLFLSGLVLTTLPGSSGSSVAALSRSVSKSDLSKLQAFPEKPRVFILSDILNEPDDSESLVRYLLYANEFDTRGICATTSTWLQNRTHPEAMQEIVKGYGAVVKNLNNHVHPKSKYQEAKELLPLVTSGPAVYGKAALSLPLSDGARLLIKRLEESKKPLYVPIWGGSNVLAQALQEIQKSRSSREAAELRSRLRVYAISDQDDTGDWIRSTFPDVFYIAAVHGWSMYPLAAWRAIAYDYPGASPLKVEAPWLKEHIQIGPLGAQYPTPTHMMEGDTPSFLYLVQNGLGNPEYPEYGSWGGRYGQVNIGSKHYADVVDTVVGIDGVKYNNQHSTVFRWRDHFQNDFAARMSWTTTSDFWSVSHPPVPIVNGSSGPENLNVTVRPNQKIILDGSKSYDPDHPKTTENLSFQWYQYIEPTYPLPNPQDRFAVKMAPLSPPAGTNGTLVYNDSGFRNVVTGNSVEITVPGIPAAIQFHVILEVKTLNKELPLRRYKRVILSVQV